MALQRFKKIPLHADGKKIAELQNCTYKHDSNDMRQHGVDGVMGFSDGNDETEVTADCCVPFGGMSNRAALRDAIAGKRSVQLAIPVDGSIEMIEVRCTSRQYTSDSKTGELKGSFTFQGGKPEIV